MTYARVHKSGEILPPENLTFNDLIFSPWEMRKRQGRKHYRANFHLARQETRNVS